jgi:hypothetical protein
MNGHEILLSKLLPLRNYLNKGMISETAIAPLEAYIKEITLLSSLMYKQRIDSFQRVTINSRIFNGEHKRITDINYLKYPPKEFVSRYGRANYPKQSILYATAEPITALSEMRPEIGDLITISTWKLKTNYDLTVTPLFKNHTKNGLIHNELSLRAGLLYEKMVKQYDENTQKQLDIILQFIADCFSKDVDDNNHFDYFLSSYYANRIFKELENGEVDAILYPSVRQSLTISNIAMKPEVFDANYELELVEESTVMSNPSKTGNAWYLKGSGYSKSFKDGKIEW